MSTLGWIVLAVAVIALVAMLVALARWWGKRRDARHAQEAERLRAEAQAHDADVAASRYQVTRAEEDAAAARRQAEEAERAAAAARESLAHEQARQEDLLRRADEVDPAVDEHGGAHADRSQEASR